MANTKIPSELIADSSITAAKLADGTITTADIADSNVTTAKIADSNVTTAKIGDAQVTTAKIVDANVTTAKIADSNVTTAKILDNNITSAKLASALTLGGNTTFSGNIIKDSGHLTLDSPGDIHLDVSGQVKLDKNGTLYGNIFNSSNSLGIHVAQADKDIIFSGNDGGSTVNALTLDMSDAGAATFNSTVTATSVDVTGAFVDSAVNRGIKFDTASMKPSNGSGGDADNHVDLGTSSARFKNLHLAGTIASGDIEITSTNRDMLHLRRNSSDGDAGINFENTSGNLGQFYAMSNGNFFMDASNEVILDSSGGIVRIYKDGGNIGAFQMNNNDFYIRSMVSDKDIIFQGYDGSSNITALSLDMSEAGAATFNNSVTANKLTILAADGVRPNDYVAIFKNQEATNSQSFGVSINAGSSSSDIALNITDHDGSNTLFRILGNGNTGIGTAPSARFHVANAATEEYIFETTSNNTRSQVEVKSKDSSGNAVQARLSTMGDGPYGMLYTFTNHNLTFATNNAAPQMTLDTSGNVGIGETNPETSLHIKNSGNSFLTLERSGTTGGTGKFGINMEGGSSQQTTMAYDDGGKIVIGRSSDPATMANFSNDFTLDSSGNVGIGETGPAYRLQVDGTNVSSGGGLANLCLVDRTAYNGTLPGAGITFRGEYTSGGNTTNFATIQGIKENTSSGNYDTALRFTTRANGGNLTERLRINSSGNVGIGTTSIETELHIKGTNNSAGDLYTEVGPGNTPSITIQNAGTTDNNNAALFFRDDADMRGSVAMRFTGHSTHSSELRFSTAYANNTREKVLISSQGQIGINKLSGLATGGFGTPMLVIKQAANSQWGGINLEANGNDAIFAIGTTDANHVITGSYRTSAGYKPIMIGAAGSMRMRFDTNGRISMGDNGYTNFTSPDYPVHICADGYSLNIESGTGYSHFGSNNTTYFHIVGNRYYYFGQRCEASGGFHTYSDENLKKEITPITGALDDVAKMNGVTFKWKDAAKRGGGDAGKQFGVTAQNMLTVDSELPTKNVDPLYNIEDSVSADDEYYTMDYSRITPFLIEAVKELKTKLEAAEARIKTLEG